MEGVSSFLVPEVPIATFAGGLFPNQRSGLVESFFNLKANILKMFHYHTSYVNLNL